MHTILAHIDILAARLHQWRVFRFRIFRHHAPIRLILPYVAWLILAPLALAQSHGTAVVILATPDTILAAADSKVTVMGADGKDSAITPGPFSLEACKILRADDRTFLAIQGY